MIELSKACVLYFKVKGDKDAVLIPYYDRSDPRYSDKGKKKWHKDAILKKYHESCIFSIRALQKLKKAPSGLCNSGFPDCSHHCSQSDSSA